MRRIPAGHLALRPHRKAASRRGLESWNGGANYYTVAQVAVGGVDAANCLMAVKHLVFDEKKLTMAELKKALAANFEGNTRKSGSCATRLPSTATTFPR